MRQCMETFTPFAIRIAFLALLAGVLGTAVVLIDSSRGGSTRSQAPATRQQLDSALVTARQRPAQRAVAAAAAPAATGNLVAATETVPQVPVAAQRIGGVDCTSPHQVVRVPADAPLYATPGGARIGTLPAQSHYLGQSMTAWVQAISPDKAFGRVTIPWTKGNVARQAWVALDGLSRGSTKTMVVADLSEHRLRAYRGCREVLDVPSAIGAAGSPSPVGRFWVTDRIAVPRSQPAFGSYAFGLSTFQPHPPAGWTGGNQMAIHGTNAPSSIGTAASAGCLRVAEPTLATLKPLLRPGTPVIIQA